VSLVRIVTPSDQASVKARTVPAVWSVDETVGEVARRQGATKTGFKASDAKKIAAEFLGHPGSEPDAIKHHVVFRSPRTATAAVIEWCSIHAAVDASPFGGGFTGPHVPHYFRSVVDVAFQFFIA
jgi:hypothetical protein